MSATVDELLAERDTRILLVCGAGGVGKTTVSAALAVRAAEAGRRVALLTIDPAHRLVTALGMDALGTDPQPVPGLDLAAGGSLDAMMLDMKRTFDDAIRRHADPDRAEALLRNPFYDALSTSFSGTQEYMAMEKLGELYAGGVAGRRPRWDLIVVDTPPSASALDFLDAPDRLGALLDGPLLRTLMAPARGGLRFLGAGMNLTTPLLSAVIGAGALTDLRTFVTAFDSVLGGFRDRARRTRRVLSSQHSSCLIVTTPEPDPLREAVALEARLRSDTIRCRGVVVNQLTPTPEPLTHPTLDDETAAAGWARAHRAHLARQAGEQRNAARSALGTLPRWEVPQQNDEVTDVPHLRRLAAAMNEADG